MKNLKILNQEKTNLKERKKMKKIISSVLVFAIMGIPMVSAAFADKDKHNLETITEEPKEVLSETEQLDRFYDKELDQEEEDLGYDGDSEETASVKETKKEQKGMSTTKKVALGVGAVVVIAGAGYAAYTYCPTVQSFIKDQALPFLQGCGNSVKNFISKNFISPVSDLLGTTPDKKLNECQRQLNECTSSKITFFDKMTKFMLGETVFLLGSFANHWLIGKGARVLSQILLVTLAFF